MVSGKEVQLRQAKAGKKWVILSALPFSLPLAGCREDSADGMEESENGRSLGPW